MTRHALLAFVVACSPKAMEAYDAGPESTSESPRPFDRRECKGAALFFDRNDPQLIAVGLDPIEGLADATEAEQLDVLGNRIGSLFSGAELLLSTSDEEAIATTPKNETIDRATEAIKDSTLELSRSDMRISSALSSMSTGLILLGLPAMEVALREIRDGAVTIELRVVAAFSRLARARFSHDAIDAIALLDADSWPPRIPDGVEARTVLYLIPQVAPRSPPTPPHSEVASKAGNTLRFKQLAARHKLETSYTDVLRLAPKLGVEIEKRERLLREFAEVLDQHLGAGTFDRRLVAMARAFPIVELVAARALAISRQNSGPCSVYFGTIAETWTARAIALRTIRHRIARFPSH